MSPIKQAVTMVALGIGACAAGVAAGLMLAPASGRETRRRVMRAVEDGKHDLARRSRRVAEDAADFVEQRIEEGKRKLSHAVGQ
jgi:gas vesicle protein